VDNLVTPYAGGGNRTHTSRSPRDFKSAKTGGLQGTTWKKRRSKAVFSPELLPGFLSRAVRSGKVRAKSEPQIPVEWSRRNRPRIKDRSRLIRCRDPAP
jgi:hypothetical protein